MMLRSVLLIVLMLCLSPPVRANSPEVGKPAPVFSLRDGTGALVSLSNLAYPEAPQPSRPKKVVLLDFFSTSCAPCRKSLPHLIKLHQKFKDQAVQVVLVALLEDEDGQEKLDQFLKTKPLPFMVLHDPYQTAGKKYVMKHNAVEIPALFVIDRSGTLRAQFKGLTPEELPRVEKLMEDLLK
jgi:cytochrome c biogenesis protein CcmG, thiol:disulfide interchange protein DsbE